MSEGDRVRGTVDMLKAALIGNSERIAAVYGGGRRERLATEFDLFPDIVTPDSLREPLYPLRRPLH